MDEFTVGSLYSNEHIYKTFKVSNAGGVRPCTEAGAVVRVVLMTSSPTFHGASENPYHDRLEGDTLIYTAAGKIGEQTLGGLNGRLTEQRDATFPIHGFTLTASRRDKSVGPERWMYLGLLEYLRHYPDLQLDTDGKVRRVWLFEFKVHPQPRVVPVALDMLLSDELITRSRAERSDRFDEVVVGTEDPDQPERGQFEHIRSRMLAMEPRNFEYFVKDLMIHTGFTDVCVTRYSADGGVDVNAKVGARMWMFESALVQVQAKRWLHSVGRKEVAELRGSLQPFARGAVLTTSHFSKAALNEATENGKVPITLIDGYRLSKVVSDSGFAFAR